MLTAVPTSELTATPAVPSSAALARRGIGLLALLVILALVVSVLPGLGDVRERFGQAEPGWIAVTFACSFGSRLSYIAALRGTLSRQIHWRPAYHLGMAEQGSNVLLPTGGVGGPALGALVLRRAGVPTGVAAPRSAALFLLTSLTSFTAIALAGLLTGIGVLPADAPWFGTLLPAALAVGLVTAVAALGHLPVGQRSQNERRARRWARQGAALLRDGVQESRTLLRAHDPLVISGCIGYLALDIAALGAAFQAFGGGGPPFGAFVLAYALGQVGSLIPTPGGLGGTEGGLIAMLVVYGAPAAPAAAAVLAYRVFQLGLPAILGVLAFRQIRRRLADTEQTAEVAARFDANSP